MRTSGWRATGAACLIAALCVSSVTRIAAAAPADVPVVKACGHHDYPPWNWQLYGQIVGVCAEVAKRAIERLGYRVDLSYVGPWARCQALIEAGKVDVNICSFRNPDRERYSVFAEPRMAQNRIAVFIKKERAQQFGLKTWDDLKGMRTGLVLGVSMGPQFDGFLDEHTRVHRVNSVSSIIKMMQRDRLDIFPFGWEAGLLEIELNGLAGRIVPAERPVLVGDLFVSVAKTSPLAARIDEIGAYFTQPSYEAELSGLLEEYGRIYLRAAPRRAGPAR